MPLDFEELSRKRERAETILRDQGPGGRRPVPGRPPGSAPAARTATPTWAPGSWSACCALDEECRERDAGGLLSTWASPPGATTASSGWPGPSPTWRGRRDHPARPHLAEAIQYRAQRRTCGGERMELAIKHKRAFAVVALILIVVVPIFAVRVRQIDGFTYRYGDDSTGIHQYSVEFEDGVPWAVESFQPAQGTQEPWERRRTLSESELRAFERLLFLWLKVPDWPVSPSGPHKQQDSWRITIVYKSGKIFTLFGPYPDYAVYSVFTKGLDRIENALAVPEGP